MDKPLISIIVPTYNVEKYVEKCIKSLINQTLSNIEIILVDDGSTDRSGDICDKYEAIDKRIRVIHQTNRGLGLSRNSGIEVAEGDYIGFVDSDDFVSIRMFEILYRNAQLHNADISYCTHQKFEDEKLVSDTKELKAKVKTWVGKESIRQYMLDRIGLPPQSSRDNLYGASVWCGIFKKWIFSDLCARFVSERQFIAEDMIFNIDVIPNCKCIVHQDEPLYYYRFNPASLTRAYKPDRFQKNIELFHEMASKLFNYYDTNEIFKSTSRYLLTVSRNAIIQEVRFAKINGVKTAKQKIREICNNDEINNVLKKYEYWKLPIKYRITCFFQKYKW